MTGDEMKACMLAAVDLTDALQKLKAGRPHDFDDVIPFFARLRADLDHEYLNAWAGRLGVREELDYLWSRSE